MKIKTAEFIKGIKGTDEYLESEILQIAFYGRSNAGKSSSINALLGRNSLVKSSSTPGKTKELNLFEINETFFIVDLPGYGYAKISQTEREKLRKLIQWYILDCPIINRVNVLVLDGKVGLTELDEEILQTFFDIIIWGIFNKNTRQFKNTKDVIHPRHGLKSDKMQRKSKQINVFFLDNLDKYN